MDRSRRGSKFQQNLTVKPMQSGLFNILDGLNAGGFLADVQQLAPDGMLVFGPKNIQSSTWAGVVIWHRPAGIYHYKTVTLLGIWAVGGIEATTIIIGRQEMPFTAAHYTAESYFKHIRSTFEIHYGKVTALPDDRLYEVDYVPKKRLQLRDEIENVLKTISLAG